MNMNMSTIIIRMTTTMKDMIMQDMTMTTIMAAEAACCGC
jgi:hypothetical protein